MQALSSYVYIAANVMLHAKVEVQSRHLNELLPPIIPLLTSHHHTLRGFTQVSMLHLSDIHLYILSIEEFHPIFIFFFFLFSC